MNGFKLIFIASICMITTFSASAHRTSNTASGQAVTMPVGHRHTTAPATLSPASLSSWELSGAIAARNKKRGWTASINWLQQGPNQYQIRLFGPLGGGTVIVEKHGAVITYRDGPKRISSNNADELLQKQTGVRLPVKNLYYWVRGLPASGSIQAKRVDANNYLIGFTQAGYSIKYTAYTSAGGMTLPSKIHLQGHGVLIKLVIKHWKV